MFLFTNRTKDCQSGSKIVRNRRFYEISLGFLYAIIRERITVKTKTVFKTKHSFYTQIHLRTTSTYRSTLIRSMCGLNFDFEMTAAYIYVYVSTYADDCVYYVVFLRSQNVSRYFHGK